MQTLDFHDPEWVADKLGLERNTVYKYLKEGIIPAVRIGKKWLISESKLVEWLEQETEKQTKIRTDAASSFSHTLKLMDNYTQEAREVLKSAHTIARNCGHDFIGQEHLIVAMVENKNCLAAQKLQQLVDDISKIENLFMQKCPMEDKEVPRRLGRSADARNAMKLAAENAGLEQINSEHLLESVLAIKEGKGYDILLEAGACRS